jgi:hypothetical protein
VYTALYGKINNNSEQNECRALSARIILPAVSKSYFAPLPAQQIADAKCNKQGEN